MTYKIKREREHFEVYINDQFYCTADNWKEATTEVENYIKGGNVNETQSA